MKKKQVLTLIKRIVISALCLALLILIITFLPGNIEGQYRNLMVRSFMGSVDFDQFRAGRIINYSSNHPPAFVMGRYTKNADGSVDLYIRSYGHSDAEKLVGRAYPHFLVTKFWWIGEENGEFDHIEWVLKSPKIFTIKKTIAEHDITSMYRNKDGTNTTTYYDDSLQPVRNIIGSPWDEITAEQVGTGQPATAPESKSEGKDKPQPESVPAPR